MCSGPAIECKECGDLVCSTSIETVSTGVCGHCRLGVHLEGETHIDRCPGCHQAVDHEGFCGCWWPTEKVEFTSGGEDPNSQVILDSSPAHYTRGDIECIDAIGSMLDGYENTPPTVAFMAGNVVKYMWRAPLKGSALDDYKKAADYLGRIIKQLEDES